MSFVSKERMVNVSYLYVCKMTPIDTIFSFLFILMLENVVRENTYGKHGCIINGRIACSPIPTLILYVCGHECLIE